MKKDFFESKEFADLLDLNIKTFDYRCKANILPVHDGFVGRSRVWNRATVESYLLTEKRLLELKIERLRGWQ